MVGTFIVAAAAATTTAAVAASFALTAAAFAVNFAVSLIVSRVFGQSGQGPQDSGTRQQVPPSSINAIPIVYGNAYLGGTFVDAVLSTDQKTMYYVVAVSCVSPNGQFTFDTTDMYYGDRKITFDGTDQTKVVSLTDEAGNVDTKINGNLFISLYRSNAAGTITPLNGASAPNVVMGGADIDAALRWPSSGRQMNGLAFAIVKLNYNQDAGTTNLSPITFYAKHYLNSTGAAKPGDVWYDYITNVQYGGAVDPAFVNASSSTALNAYADQTITYTPSGGGSATQARYRMNGVLDAGQPVLNNLDKIMTCADSWMAYNAALGQWSIVINKAETAVYAFDDDNIIGEVRVSATDITQSINQVEAKFPDKGARDQPNFVNIATPSGLLYPNEPDNKYSVTYDLCNDSVQAQYLANRILEQAREDLIVSFSTTYYGIQVDAGAVVSVTNSDYGWNNKLFRVVKVNEASLPDGSLGAKLEMNEYSAAVYDDYGITQYTPVPNSDIPSANFFSALAAPTVTASNPSSAIPNFNVTTVAPTAGRVTFLELYYTTSASPTANDFKLLSTASAIDGQPITPGSSYVFTNQVLPTGASTTATYYFAFIVGNELTRSTRSPISSGFTWEPVANSGDSVDIVFRRSATQPATPSPSVGTPSGWYSDVNSVPAGTDPIWSSVGTNTGTGTVYVWQTPLLIDGQDGSDGVSIAELLIYIRATSAPSTPTGGSYNFTTQTLTAPSGWSSGIPAGTDPVYTSRAVASIQGTTGTDSTLTWSAPVLSIQNGAPGAPGAPGTDGSSSRICFARVPSNPSPVSGTIVTSGSSSFPTSGQSSSTWGFAATWVATDPNPSSTDSLYQSDGIYNPSTFQTTWGTPYISSLKVGQLSAVSTNTGSLTVTGTFQANTATISGSTMTGSGGVLYSSGNFAFGNSTTNISFNGSAMTLNGNVVATGNINLNAVTVPVSAFTAGEFRNTSTNTWQTAQTVSITTSGNRVYITTAGQAFNSTVGEDTVQPIFRLTRGGTELMTAGREAAMSFSETPAAGTYTYALEVRSPYNGTFPITDGPGVSNRSLFAIETKR
jgi:hypothetical protein